MIVINNSNDSIKVRKVGKYILQKELGRGSIGKVFLSFHSGLGIPVAVKILKPHLIEEDPEFLERFIQEGRLAVALHHKNIVRIFDAGKAGESYYLVMELLEGKNALEVIEQDGAFTVEQVLEIGCAVTDALIEAHEHGVIHRDIKPDNIMISPQGKIKLADLGLAKKLGDNFSSTMAGTVIGTPNYMSPEQSMNSREADPRSDIYSLGATLYHMITGTLPFDGESIMAVMMKHANEPLCPPQERKEGLPNNICSVIVKMMDKNPESRYQNCEQVLTALNKIRYAPSESERPKTTVLKSKKFKKPMKKIEELKAVQEQKKLEKKKVKKPLVPIIAAIATVLVLIPILISVFSKNNEEEPLQTANTSEKSNEKEKSSEKSNKKDTPAPIPPEVNTTKSFNLLENLSIRKLDKDYISYEKGVLNISPRAHHFYASTKTHFKNFKLICEYKIGNPFSNGKLTFRKNGNDGLGILFAGKKLKNINTGTILLRSGPSDAKVFKKLFRVKKDISKDTEEWNQLTLDCQGNKIIVSLNGQEISSAETELEAGHFAISASLKARLTIRRLEVFDLD